jgi:uncharacterized protein (TIGR03118 family)
MAGLLTLAMLPVCSHAMPTVSTNAGYVELDLVSDTNLALHIDPRLLNPWGIVIGRSGIWVNDNHSGLATSYSPAGNPLKFSINITNQTGDPGAPSGLVLNDTTQFVLSNGSKSAPSTFLMATEDGTILAWNGAITGTNAMIVADRSTTPAGAIYKGLAIAKDTNGAPQIYAANFHAGLVDVFDGQFNYVKSFTDTNVPAGFAPFNIRRIRGRLFVTFALQGPGAEDDQSGPGNGYVDIFDTDGTLLRRFASQGALNSPWGMAVAPEHFGKFSHALLVGNFGDGKINAFDLLTGKLLGNLKDHDGVDVVIDGLWALTFEADEVPGRECEFNAQRLYFTAGPNEEADGLLGIIRPISPVLAPAQ